MTHTSTDLPPGVWGTTRDSSDPMDCLTDTSSGCRNSIPTFSHSLLLFPSKHTSRPSDSVDFNDEIFNLWGSVKKKPKQFGRNASVADLFLSMWTDRVPVCTSSYLKGMREGTSVERKWHKSRVKLNVLTVSEPLWPWSAPPLSPVWVHHSFAEWGLLAQHLCQTTATLASAPASPSLCRPAPPGPRAWLITHIIQHCVVAGEQSAHFTTSGASVRYSTHAAS